MGHAACHIRLTSPNNSGAKPHCILFSLKQLLNLDHLKREQCLNFAAIISAAKLPCHILFSYIQSFGLNYSKIDSIQTKIYFSSTQSFILNITIMLQDHPIPSKGKMCLGWPLQGITWDNPTGLQRRD